MTTTTAPPSFGQPPAAAALHYTVRSAILTAKNFGFVIFSVAMPVLLYVIFDSCTAAPTTAAASTSLR